MCLAARIGGDASMLNRLIAAYFVKVRVTRKEGHTNGCLRPPLCISAQAAKTTMKAMGGSGSKAVIPDVCFHRPVCTCEPTSLLATPVNQSMA
jgi:hypothetical protein